MVISVLGKRLARVPYLPIVSVAEILVVRVNKSAHGNGRGVYVWNFGANVACNRGNNFLEKLDVSFNESLLFHALAASRVTGLNLIVAANDRDGRMVTQAFKILSYLVLDAFHHFVVRHIHSAGKCHIKEHNKTKLVANIKEIIVWVVSAAPYSYGVEISVNASL